MAHIEQEVLSLEAWVHPTVTELRNQNLSTSKTAQPIRVSLRHNTLPDYDDDERR